MSILSSARYYVRPPMLDDFLILIRISQATVLIPILVGGIRYSSLDTNQRLLWTMLLLSLATEVVALYVYYYVDTPNNLPYYNVYAVVVFSFLNRIYYRSLRSTIWKKLLNLLLAGFLLFFVINTVFIQPLDTFHSNTIITSNFISIILAIVYLHQELTSGGDVRLELKPLFWISASILLHNSSLILLYSSMAYILTQSQDVVEASWTMNAGLTSLMNILFAIALWVRSRTSVI